MNIGIIKESIWIFLVSKKLSYKTFIDPVSKQKANNGGMKRQDSDKMVDSISAVIANDIGLSHNWGFAVDTASTTSVSGTSEYTLKGNNNDCRSIINLRWGENEGVVLREYDQLEFDRKLSADNEDENTGDQFAYTIFKYDSSGFPKIKIYNTPTEAKAITYRYYKKGMNIEDLPEHFLGVIVSGVKSQIDERLLPLYQEQLNKMIDEYSPGGEYYASFRKDPRIVSGNQRRARLRGV